MSEFLQYLLARFIFRPWFRSFQYDFWWFSVEIGLLEASDRRPWSVGFSGKCCISVDNWSWVGVQVSEALQKHVWWLLEQFGNISGSLRTRNPRKSVFHFFAKVVVVLGGVLLSLAPAIEKSSVLFKFQNNVNVTLLISRNPLCARNLRHNVMLPAELGECLLYTAILSRDAWHSLKRTPPPTTKKEFFWKKNR